MCVTYPSTQSRTHCSVNLYTSFAPGCNTTSGAASKVSTWNNGLSVTMDWLNLFMFSTINWKKRTIEIRKQKNTFDNIILFHIELTYYDVKDYITICSIIWLFKQIVLETHKPLSMNCKSSIPSNYNTDAVSETFLCLCVQLDLPS